MKFKNTRFKKIAEHCKVKIHDPRATEDIWNSHNHKIFRRLFKTSKKYFKLKSIYTHTDIFFYTMNRFWEYRWRRFRNWLTLTKDCVQVILVHTTNNQISLQSDEQNQRWKYADGQVDHLPIMCSFYTKIVNNQSPATKSHYRRCFNQFAAKTSSDYILGVGEDIERYWQRKTVRGHQAKCLVFNVQGPVHRKYIPFDTFPTRCNFTQSIYFWKSALHVSGGNATHHQEHIQLYLQYLVLVKL